MNEFIENDKAFYWGTSAFTPQQIMECHQICEKHGWIPPIVEQCEYSMFARDLVEREYVPLFDKYGLGTSTYSPLCGGLLSGKYNDGTIPEGRFETGPWAQVLKSLHYDRFIGKRKEAALKQLNGIKAIADELGCTQAQLALAWVLKNPDVSTALTGASSTSQLEGALAALNVMKQLTPEILARIEGCLGNRPDPTMNWRIFTPNAPRR